jgi:uncharacterized membrane protein YbhN (UPF0104 family)
VTAPEPATPLAPAPRAAALRRAGLLLLVVLGVGLALLTLAGEWEQLRAGASRLSPGYLGAAALAVGASLLLSLLSWRATLAGLGTELPLRPAARIYFIGQLGKYVPGSVWPVLAQMELGAAYGLSRPVVGAGSLLAMATAVPVALTIGLLAVPGLLSADGSAYLLLFLALPVALVVLSPPVLNPLLARALRLARRPPLPQPIAGRAVFRVAGWSAGSHLLLGLQAWFLALDLGAEGPAVLPLAVGGFALASVAGLLALPVPAGAGVREAAIVLALAPVLPLGSALLLALVSRVLLTVGDLAAATTAAGRGGSTGHLHR